MAPAPSALSIATSSLTRLVKEEQSYHIELAQQESRLGRLQSTTATNGSTRQTHDADADADTDNVEYQIRQEKQAIEQTKALFPQLRRRIEDGVKTVEGQLGPEGTQDQAEVHRAQEALTNARPALGLPPEQYGA
ncbi:MAG: hypothetical protein M1826_000456 [Phylliscum demangeonii]|nr:MAG: hypothetical protein M1826_000456 [Phylliscum demangeonii]